MNQLDLLYGMLSRNKGHSTKAHGDIPMVDGARVTGCYRCYLIKRIRNTERRFKKARIVA